MTQRLREGEYYTNCKCGRRFKVRTYHEGIEREQCWTCHIWFKSVYMAQSMVHPDDLAKMANTKQYKDLLDPTIKRKAN